MMLFRRRKNKALDNNVGGFSNITNLWIFNNFLIFLILSTYKSILILKNRIFLILKAT